MLCFGGGKSCPVVETETTSETGAVLQGGREQRGTRGETLTLVFFFFFLFFIPPSSRDLSVAARVDLTTYGMVGSMNDHMTRAAGKREREREENSRRRRNV